MKTIKCQSVIFNRIMNPPYVILQIGVGSILPEALMSACLADVNNTQWNKLKIY